MLLISLQAIKFFRLLRQYKAEQQADIAAQKAEVEAERLKAQQMLEELEQLRAQISGGTQMDGVETTNSTNEIPKEV